ncbi:hypothetical protein SUDANB95_02602 [Actinosynnema sp. ALI-1.44]
MFVASLGAVSAPTATAAPWGCQFSTPNLKWKPAITNTAAYLNPAQWAAKHWQDTPTPIVLTQVTSGANILIADGFFDGDFVGIMLDVEGKDTPSSSNSTNDVLSRCRCPPPAGVTRR